MNVKDLMGEFIERQSALATEIENRFAEYFRAAVVPPFGDNGPVRAGYGIVSRLLASPGCSADAVAARIAQLPSGQGVYVIMTDYAVPGAGASSFGVPGSGLKAIYRGHSSNIRERVMGHVTHGAYMAMCASKKDKKPWSAFFKIEDAPGDGGLDITSAPYNGATWAIVAFEMKDSTRPLRELAENGFSGAFGTPARSVKEPNTPLANFGGAA
jgi:hypothetical protein